MSGQSLTDRITAAQHSVTGSAVSKTVCKATTHEIMGPKKKHLDCEWRPPRVSRCLFLQLWSPWGPAGPGFPPAAVFSVSCLHHTCPRGIRSRSGASLTSPSPSASPGAPPQPAGRPPPRPSPPGRLRSWRSPLSSVLSPHPTARSPASPRRLPAAAGSRPHLPIVSRSSRLGVSVSARTPPFLRSPRGLPPPEGIAPTLYSASLSRPFPAPRFLIHLSFLSRVTFLRLRSFT